jgi:beta-phosphoglucomutase-like phosphatase (HAD superfamily)
MKTTLPRVALFDVDGTLFDTEKLWAEALCLVFEELGAPQPVSRLMHLTYGLAWPDAYAALHRAFPDVLADFSANRLGSRLCVCFDRLFQLAPPVIESSHALLKRLNAAGVKCAYVSGSPRANITANLARCGIAHLLDAACSVPSDDMPRGKPHPDGYLLALERCGVSAADAVAFEDSRVGSTAALAAGITRTFVCPPPGAPTQAYPSGAIRVASWDELFSAL